MACMPIALAFVKSIVWFAVIKFVLNLYYLKFLDEKTSDAVEEDDKTSHSVEEGGRKRDEF